MKKEYPCLIGPGFHDLKPEELTALLKKHHPRPKTRREIWGRYQAFLRRLQTVGISFEVWVAGSFITEKPDPADVDTVVSASKDLVDSLPQPQAAVLTELLLPSNHPIVKARYFTDAYFFFSEDEERERYWMGQFGFFRTKKAKGVARFVLNPDLVV